MIGGKTHHRNTLEVEENEISFCKNQEMEMVYGGMEMGIFKKRKKS